MHNHKDYLLEKLKSYKRENIILSSHARIRLIQRQMDEEEVIENIINPKRLEIAIKEKSDKIWEEKFDCYFGYSKTLCHKYVLALNKNVIVITAVKINRRWQIIAQKKLKSKLEDKK